MKIWLIVITLLLASQTFSYGWSEENSSVEEAERQYQEVVKARDELRAKHAAKRSIQVGNVKLVVPDSGKSEQGWYTQYPDGRVEITGKIPRKYKKIKGHVYLGDGRVCGGCTAILEQGMMMALLDENGYQWQVEPGVTYTIDKHPYLRRFVQGAAVGMQQAGAQMQQHYQQQQAKQQNCTTQFIGNTAYTNCY